MLLFAPKVSAIEDFSPIYLDPNTNTLFGGTNKKEIYSLDNYAEDLSTSSANIDVITREDIKKLCDEAIKYDFKSVCVNPCYVKLAQDYYDTKIRSFQQENSQLKNVDI